ncbi:MAG: dihydrofolate reductase family protein [Ktedonobacterales bacterium]
MSKIVASEFVSLDGVVEAPDQWMGPYMSDDASKFKYDELFDSDALLLGRKTYQLFSSYWPTAAPESDGSPQDFIDRMNSVPKYVASTTLRTVEWNARLLTGDLASALAEAKRQTAQNILLYGSTALVRALARENLIDEYCLLVFPVVVGHGERLFGDGESATFALTSAQPFSSGTVALTYTPVKQS